jgi:hypothetical protein
LDVSQLRLVSQVADPGGHSLPAALFSAALMLLPPLTITTLQDEAVRAYVATRYEIVAGNSAKGIDFPGLNVTARNGQ